MDRKESRQSIEIAENRGRGTEALYERRIRKALDTGIAARSLVRRAKLTVIANLTRGSASSGASSGVANTSAISVNHL
jgi:hypothetical protein